MAVSSQMIDLKWSNPSQFSEQLSPLWLKSWVGLSESDIFEEGDFCHERSDTMREKIYLTENVFRVSVDSSFFKATESVIIFTKI